MNPPDPSIPTMGDATSRLEAWRAGGSHVDVPCGTGGSGAHTVWMRVDGAGPWVTLIHGFPTSSFDMSEVAAMAARSHRVLSLDMIGFGESEKPADHVYSVAEQADAVCSAWASLRVAETGVVAHDLGASVAQELLWRLQYRRLPVRLRSVVLANGGIYPDLHRPLPMQTALADPEQGPALSAALTEEVMTTTLASTFGPTRVPSADVLHAMWLSVARNDGYRNLHLLMRYMAERREREADWVGAMSSTAVSLGFVWGMLDPISGAHIAERIVERFPRAPRRLLDDVGHWPPIEAPGAVVDVLDEVDAPAAEGGGGLG